MVGALIEHVTVQWSTPSGSVDERLVVRADGVARLVALAPQVRADRVGEFAGAATAEEFSALAARGPRRVIDPSHDEHAEGDAALAAVLAARIADRCRATPFAAVEFLLRPTGPVLDGIGPFAVGVVGRGQRAAEFLLDPDRCRLRFLAGGTALSDLPLPPLSVGFTTVDAEGLGGVRQPARVPADTLGAIAVELFVPAGATLVELELTGSWFTDPEQTTVPPDRFTARLATDLTD